MKKISEFKLQKRTWVVSSLFAFIVLCNLRIVMAEDGSGSTTSMFGVIWHVLCGLDWSGWRDVVNGIGKFLIIVSGGLIFFGLPSILLGWPLGVAWTVLSRKRGTAEIVPQQSSERISSGSPPNGDS